MERKQRACESSQFEHWEGGYRAHELVAGVTLPRCEPRTRAARQIQQRAFRSSVQRLRFNRPCKRTTNSAREAALAEAIGFYRCAASPVLYRDFKPRRAHTSCALATASSEPARAPVTVGLQTRISRTPSVAFPCPPTAWVTAYYGVIETTTLARAGPGRTQPLNQVTTS